MFFFSITPSPLRSIHTKQITSPEPPPHQKKTHTHTRKKKKWRVSKYLYDHTLSVTPAVAPKWSQITAFWLAFLSFILKWHNRMIPPLKIIPGDEIRIKTAKSIHCQKEHSIPCCAELKLSIGHSKGISKWLHHHTLFFLPPVFNGLSFDNINAHTHKNTTPVCTTSMLHCATNCSVGQLVCPSNIYTFMCNFINLLVDLGVGWAF